MKLLSFLPFSPSLLPLAMKPTKRKTRRKSVDVDEPSTNATPLTDPNLSQRQTTATKLKDQQQPSPVDMMHTREHSPSAERSLEEALDAAVTNASVDDSSATPPQPENVLEGADDDVSSYQKEQSTPTGDGTEREEEKPTEIKTGEVKPRNPKLRILLNPLPSDDDDTGEVGDRLRREGCCDRRSECARDQGSSVDSTGSLLLGRKCSSHKSPSLFTGGDKTSAHKESQLPLPSSQGTQLYTNTTRVQNNHFRAIILPQGILNS